MSGKPGHTASDALVQDLDWDQRSDKRPFLIRQIAGVAQTAPIVASPIFFRPRPQRLQKAPLNYKLLMPLNMSSDRH